MAKRRAMEEAQGSSGTQRMKMTRMKRVLEEIEARGGKKRRSAESELDETKRRLRFAQLEVGKLKDELRAARRTVSYQGMALKQKNAEVLEGKFHIQLLQTEVYR